MLYYFLAQTFSGRRGLLNPSRTAVSPAWWTNYLKLEWFVPEMGLRSFKWVAESVKGTGKVPDIVYTFFISRYTNSSRAHYTQDGNNPVGDPEISTQAMVGNFGVLGCPRAALASSSTGTGVMLAPVPCDPLHCNPDPEFVLYPPKSPQHIGRCCSRRFFFYRRFFSLKSREG